MAYKLCTTQINLFKEGDSPVFGETNTTISLQDEGAGVFLEIKQDPSDFGPGGYLRFDFDEAETLYKAMLILKQQANQIEGNE